MPPSPAARGRTSHAPYTGPPPDGNATRSGPHACWSRWGPSAGPREVDVLHLRRSPPDPASPSRVGTAAGPASTRAAPCGVRPRAPCARPSLLPLAIEVGETLHERLSSQPPQGGTTRGQVRPDRPTEDRTRAPIAVPAQRRG